MGVASAFGELFEQLTISILQTRMIRVFHKSKEFWFPIARGGKIRSSANCQCLWAGWSNCFPTLACNNLISQDSQGQTLRALKLKFWLCLFCVKFAVGSYCVCWCFCESHVSKDLQSHQISLRTHGCFTCRGRRMCLLWLGLGLCRLYSSLWVLTSLPGKTWQNFIHAWRSIIQLAVLVIRTRW